MPVESNEDIELDTTGLDQIQRALKDQNTYIKVGILGSGNARDDKGKTASNATVGAAHEFGSLKRKLPVRSFLRVPLMEHLQKKLENSNMFDKDSLTQVIKQGNFKVWAEKVAIAAVAIVQEAFDTSGFGKWKPSTMDKKKVKQTLVETGQLRDSISYEVKG